MAQDFLITDEVGAWLFEPMTEAALKFRGRRRNSTNGCGG